jgi:hypothetical protein
MKMNKYAVSKKTINKLRVVAISVATALSVMWVIWVVDMAINPAV